MLWNNHRVMHISVGGNINKTGGAQRGTGTNQEQFLNKYMDAALQCTFLFFPTERQQGRTFLGSFYVDKRNASVLIVS